MTATATKYEPTELEREAKEFEDNALRLIEIAIDLLGNAEAKLYEEEKKHAAISPSNQGNMGRYVEASNMLDEAWEHITGRPRITVISSNVTSIRRFSTDGRLTPDVRSRLKQLIRQQKPPGAAKRLGAVSFKKTQARSAPWRN